MMDLANALQIVLDLARQNIIDELDMPEEHARQTKACDVVENLAPELLEALKFAARVIEGENLDEALGGEYSIVQDAIAKAEPVGA